MLYPAGDLWMMPTSDGAAALFVAEAGAGEIVIGLHGGPGGDLSSMTGLLAGLEDETRIVLYDRRGSYRSPADAGTVSFQADIDDLAQLVEAVGGTAHLVGYSFGCVVAAAFAAQHADRVGRIALVAPIGLRTSGDDADKDLEAEQLQIRMQRELDPRWIDFVHREGVALAVTATDSPETWVAAIEALGPREQGRVWALRDRWLFCAHPDRPSVQSGIFFRGDVGRAVEASMPAEYDFVAPLHAHRHPVTVLQGDDDLVDPGGRMVRRWFPPDGNVVVRTIPRAGHCAWVDQPDITRAALREALGLTS